jgi:hypothetical protein
LSWTISFSHKHAACLSLLSCHMYDLIFSYHFSFSPTCLFTGPLKVFIERLPCW